MVCYRLKGGIGTSSRKLAAEFGCDYLDLHKLMLDEKGELKAEFTPEGLHLTEAAYLVWRAEILKTMKWN